MEPQGELYLYNLSMLAVTFAAVSALVMVLRQTMGGKLSNFDIHLTTAYVSGGFALALAAITPPLLTLFNPSPEVLWGVSGVIAALLVAAFIASVVRRRRRASGSHVPALVILDWAIQSAVIAVLLVNAIPQPAQGVGVFAGALTVSVAVLMWSFVRRISSLLGQSPGEDWDPKRG